MAHRTDPAAALPLGRRAGASPREGLRSPGFFGRHPLVGALLFLLGITLFAIVALGTEPNGWFLPFDIQSINSVHAAALRSATWFRGLMIAGFYVGQWVVVAIALGLATYFWRNRFWPELAMVAIGWGGELAWRIVLSVSFHRPRPLFDVAVWRPSTGQGYTFPSGHAFASVVCYGLLAYLLLPKIRSPWGKAAVILAAVLIILYVGYSRVFVGEHYLSDVLAGYALGIAWSGLVYTAVEWRARRRAEPV